MGSKGRGSIMNTLYIKHQTTPEQNVKVSIYLCGHIILKVYDKPNRGFIAGLYYREGSKQIFIDSSGYEPTRKEALLELKAYINKHMKKANVSTLLEYQQYWKA